MSEIDNNPAPEPDKPVPDGTPLADEGEPEASDDLSAADREKLTEVVRKERAAAKAARSDAEKAEARLAELEAAELRRSVAEEKGLSAEQASFLSGESAEEMAASADALLSAFGSKGKPWSSHPMAALRTGATGAREPAEDMSSVAARVLD